MTIEMDLEPEMPESVTVITGTELYRIKGIDARLEYVWIPSAADALVKLRSVIDRLLWEAEQKQDGDGGRQAATIGSVARTAATVLLLLLAAHCSLLTAHAQTIGTFERAIALAGKVNAAIHTRPRSELSKPCHVGDRIKVEGVWYDCQPRAARLQRAKSEGQSAALGNGLPRACVTSSDKSFPVPIRTSLPPVPQVAELALLIQSDGEHLFVGNSGRTWLEIPHSEFTVALYEYPCGSKNSLPFPLRPLLLTAHDHLYRTKLTEAMNAPANFARHWILSYWGCGTDCLMGAAVDKQSGRVAWLPFFVTESRSAEPLIFTARNGFLQIPTGVLVYDHGTGRAPQTWRLFRGRFIRKAAR